MDPSDIPFIRMERQHVAGKEFTSPKALISRMAAMQAQDFPMAKWALGLRLPGSTEKLIDSAIDKGELLRTHLLRPTWHFVAAEDINWLLELTAPQIKAGERSRDRTLELTESVYTTSNQVIEKALSERGQLSREELVVELNRAGLATGDNRSAHLLMRAELDQVICSGSVLRGKHTYALLSERVPKPRRLSKEEALAELARRYFSSRGPATLVDFTWWSGLPAKEARLALDQVKSAFSSAVIENQAYWLDPDVHVPKLSVPVVHLLPVYDEMIISYADRTASIPLALEEHMKEISNRGMFWPIILVDGKVVGTWKRTMKKDTVLLEIQPFSKLSRPVRACIAEVAADYARFSAKKLDFVSPI